jgi:hypothetical protein
MTRPFLALLLALTLALALDAADPCVSGVPVGKRPGPYSFLVATGPQRGQQTCYICEQHEGNKPAAVVFARTLSEPLGTLLTKLEAVGATAAAKDSGYKVWCTQLADKADLDAVAKWAQQQGLKTVPVGAFEDAAGPAVVQAPRRRRRDRAAVHEAAGGGELRVPRRRTDRQADRRGSEGRPATLREEVTTPGGRRSALGDRESASA